MISRKAVAATERHQVGLYLAAMLAGAAAGWLAPASAGALELAIAPVLGILLYATFLGIPFAALGRAARDLRFLATLLALNFAVVPVVVFALTRFVADDRALLVGALLVLLTPCVDYVVVFTGLAGGAADRLLAASPILMLAQMLLLPAYLWFFAGADVAMAIDPGPFVGALLGLIVLPLVLAALTQLLARRAGTGAGARAVASTLQALMVPLMMATLAVVVGSQIVGVGRELASLLAVVPVYVAFLLVMVPLGLLAARAARLDVPATRALVFSGATRNSLVVLPLALALPEPLAAAALAVVTQTLVELVGMVALVRVVPRLVPGIVPDAPGAPGARPG